MPQSTDKYGYKLGSLRSKAAALYAQGATREDVKSHLGKTCLAVLTELKKAGWVIIKTRVRVGANRVHYHYRIGGRNVIKEDETEVL